jgi:hypothetical protein
MPRIPTSPTRGDAEKAVKLLADLLREFPFANAASRAVALSMLLTPVLRGAMIVAPMHLVTAPQPGSGKTSDGIDVQSTKNRRQRQLPAAIESHLDNGLDKRLSGLRQGKSSRRGNDRTRPQPRLIRIGNGFLSPRRPR